MKRLALTAALAGAVALTGCATNPYGYGYDPYYGYNQPYGYSNGGSTLGNAATGAAMSGAVVWRSWKLITASSCAPFPDISCQ